MNNVILKKATINDAHLLYDWAMDPIVRKASFQSGEFDFESHCVWLKKQLDNPDCDIFIFTIDNNKIGQIRLYYENGIALINYSIAEESRGKGYASIMISETEKHIISNRLDIKELVAEVKADNKASIRVFEKLDYELVEKGEKVFVFKKHI